LAGQRPLSNYTSSGKNAQLLIQPNFLFAAQTDFPWAGIVASLRIMPPAGYANIPTFIWVQIECGASAALAKETFCNLSFWGSPKGSLKFQGALRTFLFAGGQ
jgi:hypothetical protein